MATHIDEATVLNDYFEWLKTLVNAEESHRLLWRKLHSMDFLWVVDRDENRAEDGKYLRYLFTVEAYDRIDFDQEEVDQYLSGPCSVLEFLVGLARRMENDIMYDSDYDDRTSVWFHEMITNLGLMKYDDAHYSDVEVDDIIHRLMSRKYAKNGEGSLFPTTHFLKQKMSNLEIWAQMQSYILEKYGV